MSTSYRYARLAATVLLASVIASSGHVRADPQGRADGAVDYAVTAGAASGLTALSPAAGQAPTRSSSTSVKQRLEYSGEVLEPDPVKYDPEGVERWWQDYQARHPRGQ